MEGNKKAKALWGFFRKPVSKKTFENVAIVVIICIIAIIAAGNFMRDGEKSVNEPAAAAGTEKPGESQSYETDDAWSYEKDLENILSKIKGVGNVDVMITFASTVEDVPAFQTERSENGTSERDSGGGTREINQSTLKETIIYEEIPGGGKKPVVVKKMMPEVKGVVVAADGAHDPVVRESICKAVQALLDVPLHRIQVFERE